jgi:hypothetical protein
MDEATLAIGTKVRSNAPTGSYGEIEAVHTYGPFRAEPRYCVRWCYGLDQYGEPIYARSEYKPRNHLIVISEKEYRAVADSPCKW